MWEVLSGPRLNTRRPHGACDIKGDAPSFFFSRKRRKCGQEMEIKPSPREESLKPGIKHQTVAIGSDLRVLLVIDFDEDKILCAFSWVHNV